MFMGYPELEYDGEDRTEPLTDRNFNKTVFSDGAKSIVFFNDVEADDDEFDQYECFLQVRGIQKNFDNLQAIFLDNTVNLFLMDVL